MQVYNKKVAKPSDFMHSILDVDFDYMIPNKTILLSPLHGNTGDLLTKIKWLDGVIGEE